MQSNFYTLSMRYGLPIGLLVAVNSLCSLSTNLFFSSLSWIVWLATMILLYYFTNMYRKQAPDEKISYGQAFGFIFMMYIFGAIVATALRIVYLQWLNPDALDELFNQSMLALEQLNMPDKATVRDTLASYMQPIKFSFLYLWIDLFSGIFYALIIAIIFTRRNARTNEPAQSSGDEDIVG